MACVVLFEGEAEEDLEHLVGVDFFRARGSSYLDLRASQKKKSKQIDGRGNLTNPEQPFDLIKGKGSRALHQTPNQGEGGGPHRSPQTAPNQD